MGMRTFPEYTLSSERPPPDGKNNVSITLLCQEKDGLSNNFPTPARYSVPTACEKCRLDALFCTDSQGSTSWRSVNHSPRYGCHSVIDSKMVMQGSSGQNDEGPAAMAAGPFRLCFHFIGLRGNYRPGILRIPGSGMNGLRVL